MHSLLWLVDQHNALAPSFWYTEDLDSQENRGNQSSSQSLTRLTRTKRMKDVSKAHSSEVEKDQQTSTKILRIEEFADALLSTASSDISCMNHHTKDLNCLDCKELGEKIRRNQSHRHTFTCHKKRKSITINELEGHGISDGLMKGPKLSNIPVCRFQFPKFPLDCTKLVLAIGKDIDENMVKERKSDLNKIIKFLIRQSEENMEKLKSLSFYEFLYEAGMFSENKFYEYMTNTEKEKARDRYLLRNIC